MMITVVVKEPSKPAETREIDNGLEGMQAVVRHGTYEMIELVPDGPDDLDLWANEEGKYATDENGNKCEANLRLWDGQDFLMGTAFMAATDDEGEAIGLTSEQQQRAIAWLNGHAVSIMQAATARAFADQF
jgi:hypothetical protein